MEKERLFDMCRKDTLDNAIGMIVSNRINIGGGMVGLTVDNAVQAVNDVLEYINKPKRKPLPDGTLELTDEELKEFAKKFNNNIAIYKIFIFQNKITMFYNDKRYGDVEEFIDNYKAILWLNNRFDLTGE